MRDLDSNSGPETPVPVLLLSRGCLSTPSSRLGPGASTLGLSAIPFGNQYILIAKSSCGNEIVGGRELVPRRGHENSDPCVIPRSRMFIHSLLTPWTRRFHARPFDWPFDWPFGRLRTCSSFGNPYKLGKWEIRNGTRAYIPFLIHYCLRLCHAGLRRFFKLANARSAFTILSSN